MLAVGSFIADRKEVIICSVFTAERPRCSRSDPTEDASMHQRILLSTSCESPKANRKRKDPSYTLLYCAPPGLVHGSGHTAPFQQGQNPPQRTLAFEKCEKSPRLHMVRGDEIVSGVKCSSVRGKMLQ